MGLVFHEPTRHIEKVAELFESGKLVSEIDKTYPLAEVPHAMTHFGTASTKGKLVIAVR
jgi:NADPH:quinone reductase-like Zn-dependent oxidoreductase